jgi:uncharacterized protein (DUF983 family)
MSPSNARQRGDAAVHSSLAPPQLVARTSDTPLRMPTLREALRGFRLALSLRCPHCARGFVLTRIGAVRERCAECGFRFTRTDDHYFGGAVFFGLFCGELAVALTLLIVVLLTWPAVPWQGILYGTTIGSLLALPVSLPFAKVVWLSVDVMIRPIQPEELT